MSDPEQLDRTVKITSPLSWMALAGAALIIVAVIIWSITARIPRTAEVSGVLVSAEDTVILQDVPSALAPQLKAGMKILIYPEGVDQRQYGHMEGEVEEIGGEPAETGIRVTCSVRQDSSSANGYYWSNPNGCQVSLLEETLITGEIILAEEAPIHRVLQGF